MLQYLLTVGDVISCLAVTYADITLAPSYFSQFFEEQLRNGDGADSVRTLYIDRDPATFEDISLHLQGYHIELIDV